MYAFKMLYVEVYTGQYTRSFNTFRYLHFKSLFVQTQYTYNMAMLFFLYTSRNHYLIAERSKMFSE